MTHSIEHVLFVATWAHQVAEPLRQHFLHDLGQLVQAEVARERRRLATDQKLYQAAVEQTAAEIQASASTKGA